MNRLKLISKSDLEVLHNHYLKFEPYSDFNVVSIWGYMVPGARYMYQDGNVLYEMTNYNNGEKYLSIFGDKSSRRVISKLAKKSSGNELVFYNVPEQTCDFLKGWDATKSIQPDESNHDYVFSVETMASLESDGFKHNKKRINKLLRNRPKLIAKPIDHHSKKDRRAIYTLFKRWIKQSGSNDWHREYRALQRALHLNGFNIVCIGAYDGNKLVGYTVNEIEKNGYYTGHYGKADYNYRNLGLFLEHETAKYINQTYGLDFINLQQDLGIEGIRYYKSSLGPIKQLKKYTVTIDRKKAARAF